MTKIVRKVNATVGLACGFWMRDGAVRHWWDAGILSPEEASEMRLGWESDEGSARVCGTTLAALRAELTEEGEDA